jgi:hypothetical protein
VIIRHRAYGGRTAVVHVVRLMDLVVEDKDDCLDFEHMNSTRSHEFNKVT